MTFLTRTLPAGCEWCFWLAQCWLAVSDVFDSHNAVFENHFSTYKNNFPIYKLILNNKNQKSYVFVPNNEEIEIWTKSKKEIWTKSKKEIWTKSKKEIMNKIKERNTFSIEVNSDESSPAHQDHADPSILDSSDMERLKGRLVPRVSGWRFWLAHCRLAVSESKRSFGTPGEWVTFLTRTLPAGCEWI